MPGKFTLLLFQLSGSYRLSLLFLAAVVLVLRGVLVATAVVLWRAARAAALQPVPAAGS